MTPEDKLEISRSYRRLFLNEDGTWKPDAEMVMRDIEAVCGWMTDRMPQGSDGHVDPLRLAGQHAKRGVYAHIKRRIFDPLVGLKKIIERE